MPPADSSRQGLLEKVLADYMERLDRGEAVDRAQLVRQHPELAEELQSYFSGGDELERLGRAVQTETLPPGGPAEATAAVTTAVEAQDQRVGDYDLLEQIGQGG